jgi:GxxExxY protein
MGFYVRTNGIDKLEKLILRNDLSISEEAIKLYDLIKKTVSYVYDKYGSDIYREPVYTSILGVELEELGYQTNCEEKFIIYHKNKEVGFLIADLVVRGKHSFVIEAKKIDINRAIRQLIGYMRAGNFDYGFVVGYLRNASETWMVLRETDDTGTSLRYYMYNGCVREIPTTGDL